MARIFQINISPGGIPKRPVESVFVSIIGLEGDVNQYRKTKRDNSPDQAVLLIPKEHIETLAREGWPLVPGSLGENFTTEGISYDQIRIGDVYRVGTNLEIEITKPCQPCGRLRPYGEQIINALRDRRGFYARVLTEGVVRAGDNVHLLNTPR